MLTLHNDVKTVLASDEAPAVIDFDTKAPKPNKDGVQLYQYQIKLKQKGERPVIQTVKAPAFKGDLSDAEDNEVNLRNLAIRPWENNGRSGLSFTAEAVEVVAQSSAPSKAVASS